MIEARRIITCEADLREGVDYLLAVEPRFEIALRAGGPPPLRRRPGGFAALFMILVEQQVSVASGRAIWARIEAAGCVTPQATLGRSAEELRALGLSRPKARYAHEIAHAVAEGRICFDRLAQAPTEDAMTELCAVTGIGRWTAEVYLMFSEGRADLLPVGDIALQEAAKVLFDLDERPKEKVFDSLGAPWSPWRAVAARMLWAYYRHLKGRDGKA